MRVIVTGAAGFIGSNIVHALNARGIDDIIAVDDLSDQGKAANLRGARLTARVDLRDFYEAFAAGAYGRVEAVLHQGACSDTMVTDERFMMTHNHDLPCRLSAACQAQGVRLIYASSAAVYGGSERFRESPDCERPLNLYGQSKLRFDQHLRQAFGVGFERAAHQVVGLRYFNVYGPREQHKGRMASVAFHQSGQWRAQGHVNLFGAYGGFAAGEQRRDFIHVDDVVAVNLWLLDHPEVRGLFNVGTGRAQSFNEVALAVVNALRGGAPLEHGEAIALGLIRYVDFPQALRGKYQCHTQADLGALRQAGYAAPFCDVASGVSRYMAWLTAQRAGSLPG